MGHSFRVAATAALLVCCIGVPAAYAQGPCSLQTITGTYVVAHKGSVVFIDTLTQPNPPLWVAPALAPFADVAEVTLTPDGVGDGFHWTYLGSVRPALEPRPLHVTITEMNEDCTGKMEYTLSGPGALSTTITERFIVFDEGRELRSLPTAIVNGVSAMAWVATGHRIGAGAVPVNTCGPQTARGQYVVTCENLVTHPSLYPTTAVADTLIIRADVSMTGDYTGTLYERLGQYTVQRPAWGTFSVNPDCSFTGSLVLKAGSAGIIEKGVFFNEGKELYGMAILNADLPEDQQGLKYSMCHATRSNE